MKERNFAHGQCNLNFLMDRILGGVVKKVGEVKEEEVVEGHKRDTMRKVSFLRI